jgi:hypothetical protein
VAGTQDRAQSRVLVVSEAMRCKSVPRSQFSRTQKPFGGTSTGHSGQPNTDAPIAVDQKLVLVEWRKQRETGRTTVVCFGRMTRQVTSGRNKRWVSSIQAHTLYRWVAKRAARKAPLVHTWAAEAAHGLCAQNVPKYFCAISSLSSTAMKLKLKSVFGTGNTKGL